MTADEAGARILQSRQTLNRYAAMMREGPWPVADLLLMQQEVVVLAEIASNIPPRR